MDDILKPKTEKEAVHRWHDRISTSKKYRDRMAEQYGWERFVREYKGKYDITLGSRKGRINVPPINQVFSYVQSDIAGMYFRDPYLTVIPKKSGTVRGAAIMEAALNYHWRELKIKEEIEYAMLDADLVGHGWMKDGYNLDIEGSDDNARVKKEGMYVGQVSWRDVVFNIGSRRPPKDCLWMAHRIVRPREQAVLRYTFLSDIEGSTHPHLQEGDVAQSQFKDDVRVVIFWEVHDALKRETFLLVEGYDKYVKKPTPWPEHVEEFSLSMLWYYQMPDEPYPMSPIAPWEPQILETNKLFAQALNHVKRWNRQAFVRSSGMTDEEKDKFEEGVDGSIIEVPGQGSMADMLRFADFGTLPPDIYLLLDRLAGIERETNGQPEFERGGVTKTNTRTLGELEQIATGSKTRMDKRVDRLETYMESVARHLLAHMKANFDVEQTARIVDETPEEVIEAFKDKFNPETGTVVFSKEDIAGEYDVEVKAGSTLPLNKQARVMILREVLELAVKIQGPVPLFAKVIILDLLRDYQLPQLKDAFEIQAMQAEKQAAEAAKEQSIDKAKIVAETEKRKAQADQIDLESAIMEQQLTMAPDISAETQGEEVGMSVR